MYEFLTILTINYVGVLMEKILHFPTPGTINGLILLFLLLTFKIIKLEEIENVGNFFIVNMIITFIPPSVKLIDVMDLLKVDFFKLILVLILTTIITMIVTCLFVDFMLKGEKK